jgi:glycosyltransferase involved in cell wall biosynthesis
VTASHSRERRELHVVVTVNFNDNQLRAHLLPLLETPETGRVTLVTDVAPGLRHPKLDVVVPPRRLARVATRAGAKLLVCLWIALHRRVDWLVGFHFVPHGLNVRIVGRLTRTKSLYQMIGGTTEWAGGGWDSENRFLGRQRRPSPFLERLFLRLVVGGTACAAMGEEGRRTLIRYGVAPERVVVLPPSVDVDRFRADRPQAQPYDIITVGRLAPRKRTEDLVRAVAELRGGRPGVSAAVVGDGALKGALATLARDLGVEENVAFLGFRSDVAAVYAGARIFVLTSESEALPVSMLEAMAAGVPCVVPAVGEIPGFVGDSGAALLFEPADVTSLVGAIRRLLDDEELRAAVGAAGARLVDANASVASVARAYSALFDSFA